jgi:hypothetical protein
MRSFHDFLSENNRVEEYLRQGYQIWVRRYINFSQTEAVTDPSMRNFLQWLGSKYTKPQIAHAKRALQLYSYFRARYPSKVSAKKDSGVRPVQPTLHACGPNETPGGGNAALPRGDSSAVSRKTPRQGTTPSRGRTSRRARAPSSNGATTSRPSGQVTPIRVTPWLP